MSKEPNRELTIIENNFCAAWVLNRAFNDISIKSQPTFEPGGIVGEVHKGEAILNKRK